MIINISILIHILLQIVENMVNEELSKELLSKMKDEILKVKYTININRYAG